ncbi:hypothetical protein B0H10DRAFT_1955618 [Mycena sp. CBHHK59/15]|nr:hypothetical protein B0H10DRAFT_1955618 [Mycena sp. CBHHK59/15]
MAEVAKHQALCKRSAAWLDTEGAKQIGRSREGERASALATLQRAVMKTMGWNTPLTCLRGTRSTVDLAAFLSTVWLNSDHIDMMMEDLTARVKADPDLARLYNNIYHALNSACSLRVSTVFQGIPTATSFLQTKQFAHIPSINFLCILSKTPKLTPTGLELFPEDAERFKKLQGGSESSMKPWYYFTSAEKMWLPKLARKTRLQIVFLSHRDASCI